MTYSNSYSYEPTNYSRYYYYDENGDLTYIRSYKYGEDDYNSYTIPSFLQSNTGLYDARMIYNSNNYYNDIYEINLNQNPSLSFNYTDMDSGHLLTHMSTTLLYSNLDNTTEGYYYNYYEATDGFLYTVRFRVVIKVGNPVSGYNTPEEYVSYNYDSQWKDQLESYTVLKDGTTHTSQITYDNQGNPTEITNFEYNETIYEKAELDWEGRTLINIKVYNSSLAVVSEIDYTYNDQGLRTSKIIDIDGDGIQDEKYEYKLSGSQLIAEVKFDYDDVSQEWDLIYKVIYSYDYNGSFIGLSYVSGTGTPIDYIAVTNVQGDVTHLLTAYGTEVVHYQYDAYGNIVSVTGTLASTIGEYNSIRYKGYKYDSEISMYYLNSRYYNPEIARFINADGIIGEAGQVLSSNMYAYCMNNPIMNVDSNGYMATWLKLAFVAVAVVAVTAVAVAAVGINVVVVATVVYAVGSNVVAVVDSKKYCDNSDVEAMDAERFKEIQDSKKTVGLSREEKLAYIRYLRAGNEDLRENWTEAEMLREFEYHDKVYFISSNILGIPDSDTPSFNTKKVDFETEQTLRTYLFRFFGNMIP